MILIPNSWGTLREFNGCHEPAGQPTGGQFCSRGGPSSNLHTVSLGMIDFGIVRSVLGKDYSERELKALGRSLMAGVPGDFDILIRTQRLEAMTSAGLTSVPAVRVSIVGRDGVAGSTTNPPTRLSRSFQRDLEGKLFVQHANFEKNPATDPHLAKAVLRAHITAYEALGVERVMTFANLEVGAYAWAKFGFLEAERDAVRTAVDEGIRKLAGTTIHNTDREGHQIGPGVWFGPELQLTIRRFIAQGATMWDLADMEVPTMTHPQQRVKIGKSLLMASTGWLGFLLLPVKDDLNRDRAAISQRQMARFWSYVGRPK